MFLDALKNQNEKRAPVWLMRQAGRYMPTYRALRKKHSLKELFFTPELAAEITLMPVEQLGVDAAILFSDITVVAMPLGFNLEFSEGPQITGALQKKNLSSLEPIAQAIRLIKPQIKVPLIGFCGGPFTVASYMGGDPALLEPLTDVTIDYIRMQEDAGVDAIQIFDSWAGKLTKQEFHIFCTPYLKRIVEAARVPVILFMRKACEFVDELASLKPDAISFDWDKPMSEMRGKVQCAIQGNLNPDLLYEPLPLIKQKTKELIESMKGDPGFIVNLGHGVKPDMTVDAVRTLIDTVREYEG